MTSIVNSPERSESSAANQPVLAKRERLGPSPLSYAQERLWFIHQMEPESAFYNLPAALRMKGRLDIGALYGSFQELVLRHAALRTTFAVDDGAPVQAVHERSDFAFAFFDLGALREDQKQAEARRIAESEAGRPFNLLRGPLLRVGLIRLDDADHVLLMTLHHIVSDAWSRGVLIRDISQIYSALHRKAPIALPPLPVQYADYAAWQRGWLQGEVLDEQIRYWKQQLSGSPTEAGIPTDFPRPAIQQYRGGVHKTTLDAQQTKKLRDLGRSQGVTLFMALLAAFQVVLSRLTGQTDIVVGSPIANRNRREIEDLIGFFVNTLVLRADLSGNPRFTELLKRDRDMALSAYAHQDLPFEKLVEELQPQRDLSRNPLFQISFALHNTPSGNLRLPELELIPFGEEVASVRFDLEFNCYETDNEIQVVVYYSSDLFRHSTIERVTEYFRAVLREVTDNPQQRIAEISILSEAEMVRAQEFSRHSQTFAVTRCLHQLFEKQAARTPEATAVVLGAQHLSYRALDAAANRVAAALEKQGTHEEMLVGLFCERSLEMLVGMLAILKCGAAYVPLDPQYPAARLKFIAADCKVRVIAAQRGSQTGPPDIGASVVYIEDCLNSPQGAEAFQSKRIPPESLAYVIHTSGSTGVPKGVMVQHDHVVRLMLATEPWFAFNALDRWTLFHSFAFDFSVWEIWGPLLKGGTLVVVPYWTSRTPGEFLDFLHTCQITVLNQTPSAFRQLLEEEKNSPDRQTPLRYVIFGGEALDPGDLRHWFERRGDSKPRLINMYGITETTVHVTGRFLRQSDAAAGGRSWIGRQIDDLDFYVLGDSLQMSPEGVRGEIFVGGAGVTRGYLNDAALTAERFVPHPFAGRPGERLYRSGDLARRSETGDVEYLGRADKQVKIRGFRIDPAEVAAAVKKDAEVGDAVVLAQPGGEAGKRLVAYVVPAAAQKAEAAESVMREHQLSHWQQVFDENYLQPAEAAFNISGWNSSYTNQPIPSQEMHEWVDRTVEAIARYRPTKILEIGCGTGLLFNRLAAASSRYIGTDISPTALECITQNLRSDPPLAQKVTLLRRAAHDFAGLPEVGFDTVILNSVVQYFPDISYLTAVLESAVKVISRPARIFLGDLRDKRSLAAFHASLELQQGRSSGSAAEFTARVQSRCRREEELVVHPGYFLKLKERLGASHVEVLLKRGEFQNEMTRFRYDVVLHFGEAPCIPEVPCDNWDRINLENGLLQRLLSTESPPFFALKGVPNKRLWLESRLLECMDSAGSLAEAEAQVDTSIAVDPEQIWQAAHASGYDARMGWFYSGSADVFDVVLVKRGTAPENAVFPAQIEEWQAVADYATHPLKVSAEKQLVSRLRAELKSQLQQQMMPAAYVVLDRIPLTTNGKIDYDLLPLPDDSRPQVQQPYAPPRNAVERVMADIWKDVLGIAEVGIHDSFFDLGGHSLSATQVVTRMREIFQIDFPLRLIFQSSTIAELSHALREAETVPGKMEKIANLLEKVRAMSDDELVSLISD